MGVKDVDHVSRPIRDPTRLWILRRQDEPDELVAVDPMDPVQDRQRRQHPKRIADLGLRKWRRQRGQRTGCSRRRVSRGAR